MQNLDCRLAPSSASEETAEEGAIEALETREGENGIEKHSL